MTLPITERGRAEAHHELDGGGRSRSSSNDSNGTSLFRTTSRPTSSGLPQTPTSAKGPSPFDASRRQRSTPLGNNAPSSWTKRPVPAHRRKSDAGSRSDSEVLSHYPFNSPIPLICCSLSRPVHRHLAELQAALEPRPIPHLQEACPPPTLTLTWIPSPPSALHPFPVDQDHTPVLDRNLKVISVIQWDTITALQTVATLLPVTCAPQGLIRTTTIQDKATTL